ncbi:acyl-CoA synthetase [Microbacterium thalassium]|uniref:Uncharacterized membrane protein HdeD (DUF308 family) n=1 Tax=Microbacterium thalassium TaxID=362649 RepID=A0A7X0FNT4_9MICO|nr:acyl-CoA synthetase [Microbacterium thalassium]MBB6390382.1 uncharacterized membrane protein HdeD (DUF308 family) [Microbacterium thalassium]GLK25491.1 hypothetical protein GCM10017607_28100 [Microbacterium thalassium]
MTSTPARRTFDVRHVQFARAAFLALAAVMITFSPDHSAAVGLAVFSGFAIATGLVLLIALWLVYAAGRRMTPALLGIATLVAGMAGGLQPLRTVAGYFVIVIAWALVAGAIETVWGARALRLSGRAVDPQRPWEQDAIAAAGAVPRGEARDALTVGILTLVLGVALVFVPWDYALEYTIDQAGQTFTLTGITIGVGIFGGYAAITAVYLAIAGFSPRAPEPLTDEATAASAADPKELP